MNTPSYAGKLAKDVFSPPPEHKTILEKEGVAYVVFHGFLIPHYPLQESHESNSSAREKLAVDLTKRFFRNAELGINVRFSHAEISELEQTYHALPPETEERRAAGALLVGATMNRIGRLALAILQDKSFRESTASISQFIADMPAYDSHAVMGMEKHVRAVIDQCIALFSSGTTDQMLDSEYSHLSHEAKFSEVKDTKSGDPIGIYPRQLKNYYESLISQIEMVRCVRRRDHSYDREGILTDMIRDAGKAATIPLAMIHENRLSKIAEAMEDIHLLHSALHDFSQDAIFADLQPTLKNYISSFAQHACQRIGIKTDDGHFYIPTEIAFKASEARLLTLLKEAIDAAQKDQQVHRLSGLILMWRAIALIDDMAEIRQSRNRLEVETPAENEALAVLSVDEILFQFSHFETDSAAQSKSA